MELVLAPVFLILIFLLAAAPFIFILILVKIIAGGRKGNRQRMTAEETRSIQEIHRGLQRMEKRVEALETILLDRSKGVPEAFDPREG
jgi:phage shock protein B